MRSILGLCAVSLVVVCAAAPAAEFHWQTPVSGQFNTPGNWTPVGPPGLSDAAGFDLGSAGYTVTASGLLAVDQILIGNDTLSLITSNLYALNTVQSGIQLGLSSGDTAQVTLLQGQLGGRVIEIGAAAGSAASLTLTNGRLTTQLPILPAPPPGQIVVGAGGMGTLTLNTGDASSDGALVVGRDTLSQGTVVVNGSNAELQVAGEGIIGAAGDGSLVVENRGRATFGNSLIAGKDAGTEGDIRITGSSSTLQATAVQHTLGEFGQGSLTVENGAWARLGGTLVLGEKTGAQGSLKVDGAGSSLAPEGSSKLTLAVGGMGTGTAEITSGASAKLTNNVVIGVLSPGEGALTIAGTGTELDAPAIVVGVGGKGKLTVSGGAHVDASIGVAQHAGSSGEVAIDGAGTVVEGPLNVGILGNGTFAVTGGAKFSTVIPPAVVGQGPGASGEALISGTSSRFESPYLTVGQQGMGKFDIAGGATASIANTLLAGESSGALGNVTVAGVGSQLTAGEVFLGLFGSGTLHVADGATAHANKTWLGIGAPGELTVRGNGSQYSTNTSTEVISVGHNAAGQLTIDQGGKFVGSNSSMIVGQFNGSNGIAVVDGPGSSLTLQGTTGPQSASLVVGQSGLGTFKVLGGAAAEVKAFVIGSGNSPSGQLGTMQIEGSGSKLTTTGASASYIGYTSPAMLTVGGGATLATGKAYVGGFGAGQGQVDVSGPSSLWSSSHDIHIGGLGSFGEVSVHDGARVSASGGITVGSWGALEIQQATVEGNVQNSGKLINNGTIMGSLRNRHTSSLSGSGIVTGELTLDGGSVAPGNSPGTMTVGSLDWNDGTFQLEINSASGTPGGPVGWDLLSVQNGASLYGVMTIQLVSLNDANTPGDVFDFDPAQEYHWTFLTAADGITDFLPPAFNVNTSRFSNSYTGQFHVDLVGSDLMLIYSVPEPSTAVLASLAFVTIAVARRRRVRTAAAHWLFSRRHWR